MSNAPPTPLFQGNCSPAKSKAEDSPDSWATVPPLPLPELEEFRLLEKIGEGGMGEVYKAEDIKLHRLVAVKVMLPKLAGDDDARARFLREAHAVAALQHNHVVAIYRVGEAQGRPFFVMPLLRGESLERRLGGEARLPLTEVLRIAREAAEGLTAAHAAGIVHRDIKPGNLWLEAPAGCVKVLDFGLARPVNASNVLTQAGMQVGTPGYLSPEQLDGQPVDARSDLFSLGCVLYRLATGHPAFPGNSPSAVLVANSACNPAPPQSHRSGLPAGLCGLIAQLLARLPADRPASADVVARSLRELERGTQQGTTEYVPPTPTLWDALRKRWRLVASVLACLAVLTGVGLALSRPWQKENGQPAPASLSATLDVRVWKKDDTRKGLALGEESLPLRAGDWVRIEATTNRPAYLYLIHLDAKGEASPLFPWRKYDWNDRPAEEPRQKLHLPEGPGKDGSPLEAGPAGIEAVLLLAREEPLTAEESGQLARALKGAHQRGKVDPLRGAVWLGMDEERFSAPADRGRPAVEKAGEVLDPVERVRRLLRTELRAMAETGRGVCYPFAGE